MRTVPALVLDRGVDSKVLDFGGDVDVGVKGVEKGWAAEGEVEAVVRVRRGRREVVGRVEGWRRRA